MKELQFTLLANEAATDTAASPAAGSNSGTDAAGAAPKKSGCGCGGHKPQQGGIVIYLDRILITFFVLWLLTFLIRKIFE